MYEIIDKIENILNMKKEKFLNYEQATESLLNCPEDKMQHFMDRREELIEEITKLDEDIQILSRAIGKQQQTEKAIKNKYIRSEVPKELLGCYDLGQGIFTVINRISKMEPHIVERAERIKEEAEKNIKKNNNVPKIAKYFNQYEDTGNVLVSKKYEKV